MELTLQEQLASVEKAIEFFDDDRSRWMIGALWAAKNLYDERDLLKSREEPQRCCISGALLLHTVLSGQLEDYSEAFELLRGDLGQTFLDANPEIARFVREREDNYDGIWKWNDGHRSEYQPEFSDIKAALQNMRTYLVEQLDRSMNVQQDSTTEEKS